MVDLEAEEARDSFCWLKRYFLADPILLADFGVDAPVTSTAVVFLADALLLTEEREELWESFALLGVAVAV